MLNAIKYDHVQALVSQLNQPLCLYDLETTTFRGRQNFAIMEVAAVLMYPDERPLKLIGGLVNPQRPIDPQVQQLTGIRQPMVAQQPHWGERYAPLFLRMVESGFWFAGYNNRTFDNHALKDMGERYAHPLPAIERTFDVRLLYLALSASQKKSGKLDEVANAYGVQAQGSLHRAQADTVLTLELLNALIEVYGMPAVLAQVLPKPERAADKLSASKIANRVKKRGVQTLAELVQAFRQDAAAVSFEVAKAIDERLLDPQALADAPTVTWLQSKLPLLDPALTQGAVRLKPLFDALKELQPPAAFDYIQLRAGLASMNKSWLTLKPSKHPVSV